MSEVLVVLAPGFEEIETSTIVDVLRRAEIEVTLAGLEGDGPCRGSRGIVFVPDAAFDDLDEDFDWVVLPGGLPGTEAMMESGSLSELLRARASAGRPIAAICAAPMVLDRAGVLPEGAYTCYPSLAGRVETRGRRDERVVDTPTVVTSQGPGTAMDFALHLIERIEGRERRDAVAAGLLHVGGSGVG